MAYDPNYSPPRTSRGQNRPIRGGGIRGRGATNSNNSRNQPLTSRSNAPAPSNNNRNNVPQNNGPRGRGAGRGRGRGRGGFNGANRPYRANNRADLGTKFDYHTTKNGNSGNKLGGSKKDVKGIRDNIIQHGSYQDLTAAISLLSQSISSRKSENSSFKGKKNKNSSSGKSHKHRVNFERGIKKELLEEKKKRDKIFEQRDKINRQLAIEQAENKRAERQKEIQEVKEQYDALKFEHSNNEYGHSGPYRSPRGTGIRRWMRDGKPTDWKVDPPNQFENQTQKIWIWDKNDFDHYADKSKKTLHK